MHALQNVDQENRSGAAAVLRASMVEHSVLQEWRTSLKKEVENATSKYVQPAFWAHGYLGHHAQSLAWKSLEYQEHVEEKEITVRLTLQLQSAL